MNFIYILTFILAVCSLLYELLLAQTLSFFAANTVISYSLTIGLYLLSMGLGVLVSFRLGVKKSVWETLICLEIILCFLGGISVFAIHFGHMILGFLWMGGSFIGGIIWFLSIYVFLVLSIGYLTGRELPLLIEAGKDQNGGNVNRILAADYFGSLFAGVIFPLVLIVHMELVTIGMMTACFNLVAAAWLFFKKGKDVKHKVFKSIQMITLMIVLGIGFLNIKGLEQYFLKKYYYYPVSSVNVKTLLAPIKRYDPIERTNSLYQKIDFVHLPVYSNDFIPLLRDAYSDKFLRNPDFPTKRFLYINGDYQFWSDFEDIYHEYFAHVPIMLNGNIPKNVLVLGAGDGLLIKELLKYPEVKSITHVELDPAMLKIARTHPVFLKMNEGSLMNERVQTQTGDAFHFIRNTTKKFDAIYLDFPYANDYNPSKLYSREFYYFVKKHLMAGGYAVFHAPGIALFSEGFPKELEAENDWPKYFSTLSAAGFKTIMPYIANLETDNQVAREALKKYLGDSKQLTVTNIGTVQGSSIEQIFEREAMIQEIIEDHVSNMLKGFIFISQKDEFPVQKYKSNGLNFNILNEKRFNLAFSFDHLFLRKKNNSKINSIMRPTLPGLDDWWRFRMPF